MRIVVRRKTTDNSSVFILTSMALLGIAAYTLLILNTTGVGIGIGLAGLFVGLISAVMSNKQPVLVINHEGIFDPRLGVGLILWTDIVQVHIEAHGTQRFLSIRVQNPEKYLNRLTGIRREKIQYHHKLGFSRFNLDVRQTDVSVLALKNLIDRHLPQESH